jgi:hypothetical protein
VTLSPLLEKLSQQLHTLGRKNPLADFHAMIQQIGIGHLELAAHRAKTQIASPEYQTPDSRGDESARGHRARLQRAVKRNVFEPVIAEPPGSLPQRQDFGVRGRIVVRYRCVVCFPDNFSGAHCDGPHRYFAGNRALARQRDRLAHELVVQTH